MAAKECRDYLDMTTHSIMAFANDGKLDPSEFDELMHIALRDRVVDDNEKRVLHNIIGMLTSEELTHEMTSKIVEARLAHGV